MMERGPGGFSRDICKVLGCEWGVMDCAIDSHSFGSFSSAHRSWLVLSPSLRHLITLPPVSVQGAHIAQIDGNLPQMVETRAKYLGINSVPVQHTKYRIREQKTTHYANNRFPETLPVTLPLLR